MHSNPKVVAHAVWIPAAIMMLLLMMMTKDDDDDDNADDDDDDDEDDVACVAAETSWCASWTGGSQPCVLALVPTSAASRSPSLLPYAPATPSPVLP
eukprot:2168634-Rhodomonas_salina.1